MDIYDNLLEKIDSYLVKDDVKSSKDVISANDLCLLLNKEFNLLYELFYCENLKDRINSDNAFVKKVKKVFSKENPMCTKISGYVCDPGNVKMDFEYVSDKNCHRNKYLTVYKDIRYDELYISDTSCSDARKFVNKYYNDIDYYLSKLLHFSSFSFNYEEIKQVFSDGFFDVSLVYSGLGKFNFDLIVNDKFNVDNICNKEFLTRESLRRYIYNNRLELLKKIGIDTTLINEEFMRLVEPYLPKSKAKVLQKEK